MSEKKNIKTGKSARLPLLFIILTMVIDSMGIGLIFPVMPDLIRDVNGGDLGQAAVWGGVLATSFAVMQFLCGPTVGNISDSFGRRPVLLISLAFMAVDYLVMALTQSIWVLLFARIVGGVLASTYSTATAFVADISKPEQKSARFGLISAAFGIGFVLGPVLGGLLGEFGPRAPFFAAAALAFANFILGLFVLPETVTDRIRRPFRWARANPLGAFQHVRNLPGVGRLLLVLAIYEFAIYVYPAIWAYFTQERFGWDTATVGFTLGLYGAGLAITQGVLIRPILRVLGERRTILFGLCFEGIMCLVLAFLTSGTWAMILTPIVALGAVADPALRGMMSQRVGDDSQGELQGVIASVLSLATIAAPLIMTQVFYFSTRDDLAFYMPGSAFLLASGLMVVGVMLYVATIQAEGRNSAGS